MAFKEPSRTLRIVFDDEDYAGAEVVCRRTVPMSVYFGMARAQQGENIGEIEEAVKAFGDEVLVSWNVVDDDDKPLPANGEGMTAVSFMFARQILSGWMAGMAGLPGPLVEPSSDGNTSEEATTKTEESSLSPSSL